MADQNINIKLLIDAADAAKSVAETKKALRDLKTAALSVEEGSQAFSDLTTASGKLQDKIGDLAATTRYLGDDLKNLKGFTSVASGIAGAFAAAQGAAALFGGENKQLEASLLKVQSAMSILQGIQAVGEVLQKESAASLLVENGLRKIKIMIYGQEAVAAAELAVVEGTATEAQLALNAAMKSNPIFLLIGLLVAATAALFAFSKTTEEADENQKALNDTMLKTKSNGEIEIRTFNSQIEALKTLKTGSEERAIAIKKINDQYGTTLKNLTDETDFLKQVNLAQQDYVSGAKNRIQVKINEAQVESFLTEAQIQREKSKWAASKATEILDNNELLRKQLKGKTEIEILNSTFVTQEGLEYQRMLLLSRTAKEEAETLNKKADNALATNAKLLTNETAQQKAAREKEAADALKAEQDKAKSIKDAQTKSNKEKQKAEEDHLKKMAELNAEYQQALADLAVETNDNLLQQQALLLSVSGESEANAIATERLDTEVKITEELQNQQNELDKLTAIKVKALEAETGKTATADQVSNIKTAIQQSSEYQTFLKSSNAIVVGITAEGEKAVYEIQKEWAEKRKKLLEESTKKILTTDEYKRFIDFLNTANKLQSQQDSYFKKFGQFAQDMKDLPDAGSKAVFETVEITQKRLDIEKNILNSKERDIEYQKEINKGLVEQGIISQQEVDKMIADIENANWSSRQAISQLEQDLISLKEAVSIPNTYNIVPPDAEKQLEEFYQKYKGNVEGLFDLNRKSNLDQLGGNQKSIEILSALYGEKYNIIKSGEDKINEALKVAGKSFAIVPGEGQIGLKDLINLDTKDYPGLRQKLDEILKQLNIDLTKTYQDNLDAEQSYFEKSIFENYTTQQQKLADNKLAYTAGDISKREFEKTNIQIDKDFNDTEKTLKENHEENLLAIGVVYGEKSQEDIVTFGKNRLSEKEAQAEKEKAIEDKKNAYLIAAGQSLFNTLRSFQDDMLANTLNRIEEEQELRLAAIDAELLDFDNKDKQISAAEQAKDDERKAIEDKRALVKAEYDKKIRAEKIKQFNIQKSMDVIQIGINTAVAVSRALATEKVMIPFIIAAGAAEAFFVASQQPNFADGGLVVGPGGPKDDMVKANLSNGEVVINAKSSKKYAMVLDAINQAGGGKPIPYKDGGLVTSSMQSSGNVDMEDFKSLILDIVNRPIETYVKESSITNAQKSQSKQDRRTSF